MSAPSIAAEVTGVGDRTKDMDYWNHILCSDETKKNLFCPEGVKHAWQQPGLSLSCITCINFSGVVCTGSAQTCSAGNSCATSLSVTSVGSANQSVTVTRGCSPTNQCNITGSLTFQGGKVKIATSCCDTDSCNATGLSLPADSTQLNNQTCTACTSSTSDYCNPDSTLQCYGAETMCGRISTYLSGTTSVTNTVRGCITPSVCNLLGNQQGSYDGLNVVVKTFCSNGCVNLQGTFCLSTLLMLILMKVLF